MDAQTIHGRLLERFGERIRAADLEAVDPWIEVSAASLPEVCLYLRDRLELRFNMLHCISGVDYFEGDPQRSAETGWQPHMQLLYHLSSLVYRHRLVLKVRLPRWKDGVAGELPEVPSVAHVWRTADWHEREVFDLSGVRFTGHPELRRILCPDDWEGHPLRKDYRAPDEYQGIRVR